MTDHPFEVCPSCGHTNQAALAALSHTANALADAAHAYARGRDISPARVRLMTRMLDEGPLTTGRINDHMLRSIQADRMAFINPQGLLQLTGWGYALARYYKEPAK